MHNQILCIPAAPGLMHLEGIDEKQVASLKMKGCALNIARNVSFYKKEKLCLTMPVGRYIAAQAIVQADAEA